jgi:hypothetical protein
METLILVTLWVQTVVYFWYVPIYAARRNFLQAMVAASFGAGAFGAISLINGWV